MGSRGGTSLVWGPEEGWQALPGAEKKPGWEPAGDRTQGLGCRLWRSPRTPTHPELSTNLGRPRVSSSRSLWVSWLLTRLPSLVALVRKVGSRSPATWVG